MQWWTDFSEWLSSDTVWPLATGVVLPFLAILVAGLIGAGIGRGSTKRLVAQRDRETRSAAVASLVASGTSAASWTSLSAVQKEHAETLSNAADVAVRLLPVSGSRLAADWAAHQLADMRANSVNYSFQADQTLGEYRDRLVLWLHRPAKAKKLFGEDLERWRYESNTPDPVAAEQQRWAEQQVSAQRTSFSPTVAAPAASSAPTVTPSAPTAALTTDGTAAPARS